MWTVNNHRSVSSRYCVSVIFVTTPEEGVRRWYYLQKVLRKLRVNQGNNAICRKDNLAVAEPAGRQVAG